MSVVSTSDIVILGLIAVFVYFVFIKSPTKPADKTAESSSAKDAATLDKDADLRVFTREELRKYDGKKDPKVYIAIANKVFDCTEGANAHMYAPGGEFEVYAGRDISRAVAKFSVDEKDLANSDTSDLNYVEKDKLRHMFNTFYTKFTIVGKLAKESKKTN